ncbi:glutamate synthase subunit beta [Leptospira bandrabouensis]|uniref:Glutamate synthase subunit beta n=1 Tax=Leptospira bandrabouensis TaxID=2484903 RepID=A0A6H3NJF4_9LEPT|nr:glutamate synthase subunit beta [Leptospira bandrabouensis]MCG6146209.1 glutamate synthase subunit beta [Leptospira bandrabouensis]MCG6153928.1 glutamate synthase subunit beta [Leptospira bandrabouensis]MCG6161376.1 glutamate synthase subunit beta [Leptospira bandrabouensis]MCG6165796.1 glutamate synthase subunit beta [Leptospira bandrabouensis]MCW7457952.1 glutamate synthase subunit beta [Leptospira bandrabouensis]
MGKPTGFLEFKKEYLQKIEPKERVKNYKEFEKPFPEAIAKDQGARCMDCGIPFCHGETGCPVDNLIPEFNDFVYRGRWKEAWENLSKTNNFPEFTGRLCPAPCESACTLGIIEPPVSIKSIERTIIDRAWEEGWVIPQPPVSKSGKKVAVVGSGPAGLAAGQQLARAGHTVTIFEKNDRIGGLLRYGIPDFKMEKRHIDRRMKQMEAEGVTFKTNVNVGVDITAKQLLADFDAVVLACGSEVPRDLPVEGRNSKGVHFAMEFLSKNNKHVAGDDIEIINAKDKHVIVIGGGDTGSDCVGTSNRHGAKSVTQIELFPEPPKERDVSTPWPLYPKMLRTSTSHEEGVNRRWAVSTMGFKSNEKGEVTAIYGSEVKEENGKFSPIPGTEFEWPADLVFLAMGFVNPVKEGLLADLQKEGLELDGRGNVKADFGTKPGSFATSVPKVYACGDVRRGQSLIVWAISEGRKCADQVHHFLMQEVEA